MGSLIGTLKLAACASPIAALFSPASSRRPCCFKDFTKAPSAPLCACTTSGFFRRIAITPITLSEVLWGELIWDASKATLAAEVVALIGVGHGAFPPLSLLTLLPICFLSSLLFSGMGLAAAAYSRSIDELSYPQYLLVFPMFLFCGVFYPVEDLPRALQAVAWIFPLTSVNSLVRTLTLGLPFHLGAVAIFAGVARGVGRGLAPRDDAPPDQMKEDRSRGGLLSSPYCRLVLML